MNPKTPWIELPRGGRLISEFAKELCTILVNAEVRVRLDEPHRFRTQLEDYAIPYVLQSIGRGTYEKSPRSITLTGARTVLASPVFQRAFGPTTRSRPRFPNSPAKIALGRLLAARKAKALRKQ